MSTKDEIKKRVDARCATFSVGDKVNTLVDGEEIEGEIKSIEGNHAQMETGWGEVKIWLAITRKIEGQSEK